MWSISQLFLLVEPEVGQFCWSELIWSHRFHSSLIWWFDLVFGLVSVLDGLLCFTLHTILNRLPEMIAIFGNRFTLNQQPSVDALCILIMILYNTIQCNRISYWPPSKVHKCTYDYATGQDIDSAVNWAWAFSGCLHTDHPVITVWALLPFWLSCPIIEVIVLEEIRNEIHLILYHRFVTNLIVGILLCDRYLLLSILGG